MGKTSKAASTSNESMEGYEGHFTEIEQPGKVADRSNHTARAFPPVGQVLYQGPDRRCLKVDIHTGSGVTEGSAGILG